jgi:hypothetical protein
MGKQFLLGVAILSLLVIGAVVNGSDYRAPKIAAATPAPAPKCDAELQQVRAVPTGIGNYVRIVGQIVHNCTQALGVQLEIVFRDHNGQIIDVRRPWPASISNIEPNTAFAFSMNHEFGPGWQYTVKIIEKRRWSNREK